MNVVIRVEMAAPSHANPSASHNSHDDPRDLVVARIRIELPAALKKLSSLVVKRISASPAGLSMEVNSAQDADSDVEILQVLCQPHCQPHKATSRQL